MGVGMDNGGKAVEGFNFIGLQSIVGLLKTCEVDLTLLNLTGYEIDRVLGQNNEIIADLIELLNERSKLLLGLDEDTLLGLRVLTQKGRTITGLLVIVQQDGAVLLHGNLGGLEKGLGTRQDKGGRGRGGGGGSGRGRRGSSGSRSTHVLGVGLSIKNNSFHMIKRIKGIIGAGQGGGRRVGLMG